MLDWKITDAPDVDETRPAPAAPPPPTRRGLPRSAWLLMGSVIILAVLGAGVYSWWTRASARLAVQQALAQESSAVAARDAPQINKLYGTDDANWGQAYTRWALDGQAAPRPQPFLYPLTTTGQLTTLEPFASNVLRGEVARPFSTTQGQVLTFTTDYFFAFNDDLWQRIAPPANYWGQQQAYLGPYLTIFYWEPDQALVEELGPYLNHLLAQVCAEWDCPADYKYQLHLTDTLPRPLSLAKPPTDAQPTDPLFFDVVLTHQLYASEPVFRMASPRVMGYPADAASRDYFRRALGWLVLGQTSAHFSYPEAQNIIPLLNPLYFGLLVETGVRLGLDAPQPDLPLVVGDLTALDWVGQWGGGFSLTTRNVRSRLRSAQAFTHELLQDEPPETEARLLLALWEHTSGLDWMAQGLGLTPEAAQARLDEAMRAAIRIQSRVSGDFDWALACAAGPAVLALSEGEVRYLLSEADAANNFYYGGQVVWAADGERIVISGHSLLADMPTGLIRWARQPIGGLFRPLYPAQ